MPAKTLAVGVLLTVVPIMTITFNCQGIGQMWHSDLFILERRVLPQDIHMSASAPQDYPPFPKKLRELLPIAASEIRQLKIKTDGLKGWLFCALPSGKCFWRFLSIVCRHIFFLLLLSAHWCGVIEFSKKYLTFLTPHACRYIVTSFDLGKLSYCHYIVTG